MNVFQFRKSRRISYIGQIMASNQTNDPQFTRQRKSLAVIAGFVLILFLQADAVHGDWHPALMLGIAGAIIMALTIGANDAGNLMASSVGARLITLPSALILAAICEVAGAIIGADTVVTTVTTRLLTFPTDIDYSAIILAMICAPFAAASWIALATILRLPVSTTHSLIGAITGAAIALLGSDVIAWPVLLQIAMAWLWSPFAGFVIAAGLYALFQMMIIEADDPAAAFKRALPLINGSLTAILIAYVTTKTVDDLSTTYLISLSLLGAVIVWGASLTRINTLPKDGTIRVMTATYLRLPVLFAASGFAFAHGANDVANVIAPLAIIQHLMGDGQVINLTVETSLFAVGGVGIALGILLFGGRLTLAIGRGLTRLSPLSTLAALMGVALTVLFASSLGLPVSSTHTALAAIFGVGIAREMLTDPRWRRDDTMRLNQSPRAAIRTHQLSKRRRLIRRNGMARIVIAWVITLPLAASFGWAAAMIGLAISG